MKCPTCGVYSSIEDNFCRRCGATIRNSRLPVRLPVPQLPAVWHQAAPVVARGAALIAAGVAAEWLLRSVTKRALGSAGAAMKSRALAKSRNGRGHGEIAVMETVVARRVVVRR